MEWWMVPVRTRQLEHSLNRAVALWCYRTEGGGGVDFQGNIPYCGLPLHPEIAVRHWNLDPVLLLCLAAILCVYAIKYKITNRSHAFFMLGWGTGVLALVSPLCAVSVSLFSARIGQHLIL